ncbi:similar to MFS mdr transporter, partial sequence [Botrytis cinerea T4]|uniref:Similar to MFS mdr transporter, partial sequence n=1 Tax=Botryotinia fuckeliana (strain T4) TaxID=999810 RepID=G2Y774_BOTF4
MSIATNGMIQRSRHDEFTPLLSDAKNSQITKYNGPSIRSDEESIYTQSHNSLGVFIANADGSLVLATSGTISSEFNDLGNAGWLISSYMLAMCATQSLYGKLSDIYGRKSTILASYVFFALGCAIW